MPPRLFVVGIFLILSATGCQNEDQIRTYQVSKELGSTPPFEAARDSHKEIEWTTPSGWREQPASSMRVGSFLIKGANGQDADVSIVPLSGEAGGDLQNINRWRDQIGLAPIASSEFPEISEKITAGGRSMILVDMKGKEKRIIAASYKQPSRTWFIKMTGDDKTVQEAKPAFLKFLKSLRFHDHP